MRGQWKMLLTGSAIGVVLGGYMISKMRDNGRRTSTASREGRVGEGKFAETVAGLASQAAEKMDDLSLRARTLNSRIGTRQ